MQEEKNIQVEKKAEQGITRRTFLKGAVVGAAAVSVASAVPVSVEAAAKWPATVTPLDMGILNRFKKIKVNTFPTETPDYKIDPLDQFGTYYVGMWEGSVSLASGDSRTYKIYVPENCRRDASCYFIAVPDGVETTRFLQAAGWIRIADKDKVVLCVFEPASKKWKDAETEADYFTKAYAQFNGTTYVYHDIFNWRWIGYGIGGEMMQRHIMKNPLSCAAAVVIDGCSNITDDELETIGATKYAVRGEELDFTYGETPVPVFLISQKSTKGTKRVINYWKKANDVVDKKIALAKGYEYNQKPFSTNLITYDQKVGTVRVLEQPVSYFDNTITKEAYDFVNLYARSGTGSPYSNSLTRSIADDHFIRTEKIIDGYQREWYTALPSSYDEKGEPMPLVIFYHGTGQSGLLASRQGDWWKVGEERGFISVCPSGSLEKTRSKTKVPQMSWNVEDYGNADDIVFTKALIEYMVENYNVDPGRVYTTGQSNGGRMSIYAGLALPSMVTAVGSAGASSLLTNTTSTEYYLPKETDESCIVPFMATMGEFDMFKFDPFTEGTDSWVRCHYFCNRYNLDYYDVFEYQNCRNNHIIWETKAGVPLQEQVVIGKRAHSHRPIENWMIWDEWFSYFRRDPETNTLYYRSKEVVLDK
ncbi:MAG: PHB depolymerase family esterase [Clostridiales bacterium]|nr:PHB depolymerase family esterase [Clostridiales bacterium]